VLTVHAYNGDCGVRCSDTYNERWKAGNVFELQWRLLNNLDQALGFVIGQMRMSKVQHLLLLAGGQVLGVATQQLVQERGQSICCISMHVSAFDASITARELADCASNNIPLLIASSSELSRERMARKVLVSGSNANQCQTHLHRRTVASTYQHVRSAQ
jgi:hypothetical protein